jgi:hypothetical protein
MDPLTDNDSLIGTNKIIKFRFLFSLLNSFFSRSLAAQIVVVCGLRLNEILEILAANKMSDMIVLDNFIIQIRSNARMRDRKNQSATTTKCFFAPSASIVGGRNTQHEARIILLHHSSLFYFFLLIAHFFQTLYLFFFRQKNANMTENIK